jgi:Arc/MetJ-type ribon-helix-helix transcriptional regulator
MKTTISVSLPNAVALKTRKRAKLRGFPSVSEYVRYLLDEQEGGVITEDELVKDAKEAERAYRRGTLRPYASLEDILKRSA